VTGLDLAWIARGAWSPRSSSRTQSHQLA